MEHARHVRGRRVHAPGAVLAVRILPIAGMVGWCLASYLKENEKEALSGDCMHPTWCVVSALWCWDMMSFRMRAVACELLILLNVCLSCPSSVVDVELGAVALAIAVSPSAEQLATHQSWNNSEPDRTAMGWF